MNTNVNESLNKICSRDLKNDTSSLIDLTDTDSIIDERQELKIAKLNRESTTKIEIGSIKNLPTIYFLIFTLVLSLIVLKFTPILCNQITNSTLYKEKRNINYIPFYFGDQPNSVKVNIIINFSF